MARRCLWLVLFVGVATAGEGVRAQDDWGLERQPRTRQPRSPRSPRTGTPRAPRPSPAPGGRAEMLLDRYLHALERDPSEGFAFERALELVRERDGDLSALEARYTAALHSAQPYAPRMILGHLARRAGHLDDARAHYEAASSLRPAEALPRIALARIAREGHDLEAAQRWLEGALERQRAGAARDDVLRQLAEIALDRGDLAGARARYDALAAGAGSSTFLRTELARALLSRGRHDDAIAELRRQSQVLAGDRRALAPLLIELARAEAAAGDDAAAITTLERAVALAEPALRLEGYELMLESYRRTDRLEELVSRLGRASRPDELVLLGRAHDELGNDDEALSAYRRALRARARDTELRVRVIQVLARAGRLDEVADEYRALIRAAPDEPRYVIELALLLDEAGRRSEALALLASTSSRSRSPAMHQRIAELYERWSDPRAAENELEIVARLAPRDPGHLAALGAQRYERGDRAGAIAIWRRILELGDPVDARLTLAGIFADRDMLPEAIAEYEHAVELAPSSIEARRGLATALERAGRDPDAELHWRAVMELAADDRAARREARERIVGIWLRAADAAGRTAGGADRVLGSRIAELTQAFLADPPDLEAGRMLAELHRRRGDLGSARSALDRLTSLEPRNIEALVALERVVTQARDLEAAIEVLRRLVDADPRRASSYLQRMAEHALALYRDEDALALAREAVARNPDDASAHRRLGDLARARQDAAAAIASYERALELDARLFDTAFVLAELHLSRGTPTEADRIYRGVVARAPDDELVERAARASLQIHLGAETLGELERELLSLALAHPDRPVFRRVLVELYEALTRPLRAFIRRGVATEPARDELRRLAGRALKPLLEALADSDIEQRRIALTILGPLGNPAATPALLALAESNEPLAVRLAALEAAAALATVDHLPRLLPLAGSAEPSIRLMVTQALCRLALSSPAAVPPLRARLADADPRARGHAALALARASDRASFASILELARTARGDEHIAPLIALGFIGGPEALSILVPIARSGSGAPAEAAVIALGAFDEPAAREAIALALFDADRSLRRAAVSAMLGGPLSREATMPLPGELVATFALRTARPAYEALSASELDWSVWIGPLTAALRSSLAGPAPRVRAALRALGADLPSGTELPIGLGELGAALDAASAARGSGMLSGLAIGLAPTLVELAASSDPQARTEALRAMARIEDDRVTAALRDALSQEESRRAALDALAISPPRGEALAGDVAAILASDPDWSIRTRAARALATLGGSASTGALVHALAGDPFAFVREEAARALARSDRGREAASALEQARTSDPEPRVRDAIAALLDRLDQ